MRGSIARQGRAAFIETRARVPYGVEALTTRKTNVRPSPGVGGHIAFRDADSVVLIDSGQHVLTIGPIEAFAFAASRVQRASIARSMEKFVRRIAVAFVFNISDGDVGLIGVARPLNLIRCGVGPLPIGVAPSTKQGGVDRGAIEIPRWSVKFVRLWITEEPASVFERTRTTMFDVLHAARVGIGAYAVVAPMVI